MSEGRFVLPETETVTMSGEAAKKLIGCGSGDAALVYIYILRAGGRFDLDDCALATGRSPAQIEGAMNVLSRLGLVSREDGAKKAERPVDAEPPKYTSEDIKRELENGEAFPQLVGEVQIALGRLLSPDDLIRLFSIYDYNGLPPEVILILVNHCIEEVQRRSGPGRKPTMKYIEKAAFSWEADGVFSLEAAEAYIRRLSERRGAYSEFSAAFGIRDRQLSSTERKYVDSWADLGFTADAAALAYDRTVTKTGRMNWRYMDSIMMSWHNMGLHTAPEIEKGDPFGKRNTAPSRDAAAYNAGGATAEELRRLRDLKNRLKAGDKSEP